jgi:hypothetical protein
VNTCTRNHYPTEVKEFRKGTKRDASQYPVLKDERPYEQWYRTATNLAKTHQVIDVFDPTCKPSTDYNKLLFEDKQQFVFNVLDTCLRTDMGLMLVHVHYLDDDA